MSLSQAIRVEIDCELCTGHGRCYEFAPNVFTEDDRGYGLVKVTVLDPKLMKEARSAMLNCPEQAIRLKKLAPS